MELRPLVCLCLLTLSSTTSAEGSEPKVVKVAQDLDVTLPCSTSTKQNIVDGYFDWNKVATKDEGRKEVFLYENKKHTNTGRGSQSEEFKGRVVHFPEQLQYGNASIIIKNTKMKDNGEYTCDFPRLQPPQKYLIKLVVGRVLKDRTVENIPGAAPKPIIKTLHETEDQALLWCEVSGKPQPEVEWRDSSGNKLPAEEPQVTEADGRFYVTLNTTVTKTDRYHCVATQETISHQISTDTLVRLNESTPGWIIAVVSVLCTLFVVGVLLAVLKYKGCITLKHNKENQKKQPAEEVKSDLSPDPEASTPLKTQ